MRTPAQYHDPSRRRLAAGAVTLAAALALAGCGGGGMTPEEAAGGGDEPAGEFTGEYTGPDVELAYWNGFTGGDGPFMTKMVEQFNSEHDNIKITPNTIQWADFYQRVPAAVQAGEGPDVGVMHMDQLATNAARNVIVPVDQVVEGLELSEADFPAEVWNAGEYNGKRYGIPLDVHSLAMYYNMDHFEAAGITEPPTDEASFMEALDKLKAAGYAQPFWMPTLWPAHLIFLSLVWQGGGEPYAQDGSEATFASEQGVAALEWQRGIVDQGYSPSDVAIDSQYVAFKNGENSITWDGIWQINDLKESGMNWGMAPIPNIMGENTVWANSHNFFITKQASEDENKFQAAQVFISWMSEHSGDWAGSGMIPARTSVLEEGVLDGMEQSAIADQIDALRFLPPVPGLGPVQADALEPAVSNAILGTGSAADELSKGAETATEAMQENLESFGG